MARYTIELRDLLVDINAKQEIDKALSTYPIYKPQSDNPDIINLIPTREDLNKKLLNHYKYREIGFDTPGRFIDELQITMEEIMPYYNEMYKSVETMHNIPSPFDNVDVTETFKEERTGSSTSIDSGTTTSNAQDSTTTNSNVESNSKNVESTTPQGEISIPGSAIDSVGYADKVTWNKNSSNDVATSSGSSSTEATSQNNGSSESSEIVEHTFTKKGNQGVNTYAHDMNEFRTSIIDVTMQIIEDRKIKELFMQVF